jgi:hypothetical protein
MPVALRLVYAAPRVCSAKLLGDAPFRHPEDKGLSDLKLADIEKFTVHISTSLQEGNRKRFVPSCASMCLKDMVLTRMLTSAPADIRLCHHRVTQFFKQTDASQRTFVSTVLSPTTEWREEGKAGWDSHDWSIASAGCRRSGEESSAAQST